MNVRGNVGYFVVSLSLLTLLYSSIVSAQVVTPEGPDNLGVQNSSRGTENVTGVQVDAAAGNVTRLNITDTRITQAWTGYYGNITGTITLQDSDSNIFYDWTVPDPQGEVFAVNTSTTVNWLSVYCLNVSQNEGWGDNESNITLPLVRPDGSVSSASNASQIEAHYGINQTDLDGLNETYYDYYTDTTGFDVAGVVFDVFDGCSMAHPYENGASTTTWEQLLLSDNNSLIFTALLQKDGTDFRGQTSDFQMLVLENGHPGEEGTTPYYFYVELS